MVVPGTPVSSTNRTDRHDITEILLKVALNTLNQPTNILGSRQNEHALKALSTRIWKNAEAADFTSCLCGVVLSNF
jgi:hypothetical protein